MSCVVCHGAEEELGCAVREDVVCAAGIPLVDLRKRLPDGGDPHARTGGLREVHAEIADRRDVGGLIKEYAQRGGERFLSCVRTLGNQVEDRRDHPHDQRREETLLAAGGDHLERVRRAVEELLGVQPVAS